MAVAYVRIGDGYLKMDSREKAREAYLKALATAKGLKTLENIIEEKLKGL